MVTKKNASAHSKAIGGYLKELGALIEMTQDKNASDIERVVKVLQKARDDGKTVFICGNGGSGSTASHFVCDLSKCTIKKGSKRFKAISLTDNIPVLLAWANDDSYDAVFVEQLKNHYSPGDVLIGISGSGNSKNVLLAVDYVNKNRGVTIGFSGYDGGKLKKTARYNIHIDKKNMQMVEDMHMILVHMIASVLRDVK
jgi:D-sedoheptulose 7-phosphate isomerase